MSADAKWYIIQTFSGYENQVMSDIEKVVENRDLKDLIQEVFVPTEMVTSVRNGKQRTTEKKVFPNYVMVKMVLTDDTWATRRGIRGCNGFVGAGSKPVPLSNAEVKRLENKTKKSSSVNYTVGDAVVITDGPLKESVGTVREILLDSNIVKIEVSMFGRKTPLDLELYQVKLLD